MVKRKSGETKGSKKKDIFSQSSKVSGVDITGKASAIPCSVSKSVSLSPLDNTGERSTPLGLCMGHNVCFFNSIVQILYSIPSFRSFVHNLMPDNDKFDRQSMVKKTIKKLFAEISGATDPVQTSKYVDDFSFPGYTFKSQYDAHECLTHIFDSIQ